MGTNESNAQILCEETFGSIIDQTIVKDPPSGLPVEPRALWDGHTCHDADSSDPFVFPDPPSNVPCPSASPSSERYRESMTSRLTASATSRIPSVFKTETQAIAKTAITYTTSSNFIKPNSGELDNISAGGSKNTPNAMSSVQGLGIIIEPTLDEQ